MAEERIYVACDKCGRPVSTGLVMDPATLQDPQNRLGENRTHCPFCENWIVWGKTKIWPESVVHRLFGKTP